jgi:3D (Asp-Asp-Asp) domain-containing protein
MKHVTIILAIIATMLLAKLITPTIIPVEQLTKQKIVLAEPMNIRFLRPIINGVKVTIYNATRAQCDETPTITADGTKLDIKKISTYRYAAISRNLHSKWGGPYNFGDTIVLREVGKHSGSWVVKDLMGSGAKNHIDLLVPVGTDWVSYENKQICKYLDFNM